MSKFYNLSDDTIQTFKDVYDKKPFSIKVNFEYIGSESQKNLIKISKIPDQYNFLMSKDLLVTINEDLISVFDDESVSILIEQELDKVSVTIDSGKIKMVKPDLNTFSGLINKYGIEKVGRANKVEELYNQQKADGKSQEEGFIA